MAGYTAKFKCSGCGSPLEMPEGAISVRCSYCDLVMRVGSPGSILKYYYESSLDDFGLKFILDRLFKDEGESLSYNSLKRQLYYLPFYRFRGMAYSLLREVLVEEGAEPGQPVLPSKTHYQQRCRHFDLTIPAFEEKIFGLDSLGVRPEVVPLIAFTKESLPPDSIMVDLTVSPEDARKISLGMYAFNIGSVSEDKDCLISEMIGESLSVIYYPVWSHAIRKDGREFTFFIDGLAKTIIKRTQGQYQYTPAAKDVSQAEILVPVQHKCPNCGFNLPTSEYSLLYYCSNCGKSFIIKKDGYQGTNVVSAVYEPAEGHYPFWRFRFSTGEDLKTVSDFSKILTGEIPLIAKNKSRLPFYLYVPAFKKPDLEMLTGRGLRLCRTQPILEPSKGTLKPEAEMVLPENEALELARFYWLAIRSRYRYLDKETFEFKPQNVGLGELIWLTMTPFRSSPIIPVKKRAHFSA